MKFRYYKNPYSSVFTEYSIDDGATIQQCADLITNGGRFTYPTISFVNGAVVMRELWDKPLRADDILMFQIPQRGGGDHKDRITSIVSVVVGVAVLAFSGPIGWAFIVSGAIGLAASYLPKPKVPSAARDKNKNTSPTYQLNATNEARPGEPIPVRYGRYRAVPDLAAPPWTEWADDENGVRRKYFHTILCLGVGEFDVENVLIGEQKITDLPGGSYTVYDPGEDSDDSINRESSVDINSLALDPANTASDSVSLSWAHTSGPATMGTWASSTSYTAGDVMDISGASYSGSSKPTAVCITTHTSTSDINDDAEKWYLIYESTFLRGTSGDLVDSGKVGGESSDNGVTNTLIIVPDANNTENTYLRRVYWRYPATASYDWLLIGDTPAYNNSASPAAPVSESATKTIYKMPIPTDAGYGPFRAQDMDYIDLEFNQIYKSAGGTVTAHCLIFRKLSASADSWLLTDYVTITAESYIPYGVTVPLTDPVIAALVADDPNSGVGYQSIMVMRIDDELSSTAGTDKLVWSALRGVGTAPAANADTTRIKCVFRADSNIQQVADKIRVDCTRKLPTYSAGAWQDPSATRETIWAICDILRNTTYGFGLSDDRFDLEGLMDIKDSFAFEWKCDAAFDQNMVRWEALKLICRTALMKPIKTGDFIRFSTDDQAKTIHTTMFTNSNIIDGSWSYSREEPDADEPDGVEGSYTDPVTWRQKTIAKTPSGTTPSNPETVELFGVTDPTQAEYLVRHLANSHLYRRNLVSFETGLEGHIPMPGDLCPVSFDLPRWGDNGQIIAVDGLNITADHDLDWTGGTKNLYLRRPDGSAYGTVVVTEGASPSIMVLPGAVDFDIRTGYEGERTHFAFGESAAVSVLILGVQPNGPDSVKISSVVYDANVYNGLPT